MSGSRFAVIAGGGTAGHTLPAVSVARALVARGHDPSTIHFMGSRRGMEARHVPEAGFGITLLPGRGIPAGLSVQGVLSAVALVAATAQALWLLVRRRPRVVVTVGGYAGLPASVAAALLRVPLVIVEQNARPGRANRMVGRFARVSAVAFPDTGLPREVVTGGPVRDEVERVDRSPEGRRKARAALGLPEDRRVLAAFGGSLGARRINEAVAELCRRWAARADLAVHHVVGARDWAALSARLPRPPEGGLQYQAVEYEERMPDVLAAADMVVCRAGGSTVAELAVVGVPAVLVPLPIAPDDHQTANAGALEAAGGAFVLPDRECTAERLEALVGPVLSDPERLAAMTAGAAIGRPGAAARVADVVEQQAARPR